MLPWAIRRKMYSTGTPVETRFKPFSDPSRGTARPTTFAAYRERTGRGGGISPSTRATNKYWVESIVIGSTLFYLARDHTGQPWSLRLPHACRNRHRTLLNAASWTVPNIVPTHRHTWYNSRSRTELTRASAKGHNSPETLHKLARYDMSLFGRRRLLYNYEPGGRRFGSSTNRHLLPPWSLLNGWQSAKGVPSSRWSKTRPREHFYFLNVITTT